MSNMYIMGLTQIDTWGAPVCRTKQEFQKKWERKQNPNNTKLLGYDQL